MDKTFFSKVVARGKDNKNICINDFACTCQGKNSRQIQDFNIFAGEKKNLEIGDKI